MEDEDDSARGFVFTSDTAPFGEKNTFERGDGVAPDRLLFLRVIEGFLSDEDIIKRIAETMYFGADIDLAVEDLTEAFRAYMISIGVAESDVDMAVFETLLRRVLADAAETGEAPETAAEQDQTIDPQIAL
ncbi:hypothetical protein FTO60_17450 (plasmid) [Octadecabacter sp. SW4]|uniref:hypothetical protein n=1 Tax=Octadecabacter sp. SW4 TaxID=2602067 RepID=UPI0011C20543|nr:hypothetical protein [Octadecabacter sp. SW4]QEE37550.1 hypothetical protein FTO60_17450 [Octadecabacter sp. SW4]